MRLVIALLTVLFFAMLSLLIWSSASRAHDAPLGWSYPYECCSGIDCREITEGSVTEGPAGYVLSASGETVPYTDRRVRQSPDGRFHWCTIGGSDTGRTLCLFVPPRGF
ncbi:hypothetical protein DEM27_32580 [Metarhizobium album]|uniref:Uncharacterized protein n=1 Tax=Metarhizobium album TaxID=2182425 RepID=A0A2U2DFT6_9HYPH|nr:hypothetical protein [Rhizobium album]PWE52138.1 hypothetical protein DEM27_32580 [Rhizobium album]